MYYNDPGSFMDLYNDTVGEEFDDFIESADDIDEIFPISQFKSVKEVFQLLSEVLNDNGDPTCKLMKFDGYGNLIPFGLEELKVHLDDIARDILKEEADLSLVSNEYREALEDFVDGYDEAEKKEEEKKEEGKG